MSERDQAIETFTAKWRARWPEWAVAEVFVPTGQRATALEWVTLIQELTDAAWGGSDARPGEAKLGWWSEELQGWSKGLRRHPLGAGLQRQPAPWSELAAALPSLIASRERAIDAAGALGALTPFAQAVASAEAGLFGSDLASADAAQAVLTSLLQARVAHHPSEAPPLQALAQAGDEALGLWTRELAQRPLARAATRPRRLWTGLAQARLARGAAAQPLSPSRALWVAWRAARR